MFALILILALAAAGLLIGWIAGLIWKERPYGLLGDLLIAAGSTVLIGLFDWYVIPALGFSTTLRNIGVLIEPPLGALLILWLVRRANRANS